MVITERPQMKRVQVAFLGDIMLGRGVNEEIQVRSPEYFWGDTLEILNKMDFVMANLECAITAHKKEWQKTEKVFYFRADPKAVEVLKAGNVSCVNLANNHILDLEAEGLSDTIKYLDAAGIKHVGAGVTSCDAKAPAVVNVKGLRIGVLGATDNEPAFAATDNSPGTNYIEIAIKENIVENLFADIDKLLAATDFRVLSVHWGPNMVMAPPRIFQDFAQIIMNFGIDIIHGHSAHNFQGVERLDHNLTLYDTGDYIDDYAVDPLFRNDWSFIFIVEIENTKIAKLRMVPVLLSYAQVNLAKGDEFELILNRMKELCEDFETPVKFTDEGLEVNY